MEQHLSQTAHLGSFAHQRFHLITDAVRRNPVIIIPMHDEIALAGLNTLIAFCAYGLALRGAHVFHPGIGWRKISHAILSVIQNYKFAVGIVLLQEILYRERHKA